MGVRRARGGRAAAEIQTDTGGFPQKGTPHVPTSADILYSECGGTSVSALGLEKSLILWAKAPFLSKFLDFAIMVKLSHKHYLLGIPINNHTSTRIFFYKTQKYADIQVF